MIHHRVGGLRRRAIFRMTHRVGGRLNLDVTQCYI